MNATTFGSTQDERNAYFTRVWAYLNTPAILARLLVSASNMTIFNKLYSNPNPPGTTAPDHLGYLELWPLHNTPAGKHDPTITALFNKIERKHLAADPIGLENILRSIFADIPASLLTSTDRTALNLPLKQPKTAHTVATKNSVVWTEIQLGGGDMLTKCWPSGQKTLNATAATARGTSKSRKPHKEANYQIRTSWCVLKQGAAIPASANAPGMTQTVDTKAQLVRHLGGEYASTKDVTYILVEYKQWHNPAHPTLDGPEAGPQITIIT